MNIEKLARGLRREKNFQHVAPAHRVNFGEAEIEKMIPHRPPMRLLDAIEAVDLEKKRIRGARTVSRDDPIFAGHFPGNPIYPGVLQLEMVGQLGLCLAYFLEVGAAKVKQEVRPMDVRIVKILHASYLAPAPPGARLTLAAREVVGDGLTGVVAGQVRLNGQICSTCIIEVYFV
ncbi:MAG: beta-hydroxyacyl-ACP dehydratase [Desulfobacterales bacterium]|nr:beta-hydroxyacyl-ACP dehydratase [Desulfobacterales bacterium]